jgi:hypothetical protein
MRAAATTTKQTTVVAPHQEGDEKQKGRPRRLLPTKRNRRVILQSQRMLELTRLRPYYMRLFGLVVRGCLLYIENVTALSSQWQALEKEKIGCIIFLIYYRH